MNNTFIALLLMILLVVIGVNEVNLNSQTDVIKTENKCIETIDKQEDITYNEFEPSLAKIEENENYMIMEATEEYLAHEQWAKVHPDSVGQSIGEKDKNGVEIYRGDILRYKEVVYTDCSCTVVHQVLEDTLIGIVTYNELCSVVKVYRGQVRSFGWNYETHECLLASIGLKDLEVIGNIFENPALLEV